MVADPTAVAMDPAALGAVETLFRQQIEAGLHPGAGLAVYRHGRLVLDLFGGVANAETGAPVEPDTLFVLFSSTKPLASMSVQLLIERGALGLDDRVARYWPGFARNGKEAVTVRHILTHRGGFPETPTSLNYQTWLDWNNVVAAMEAAPAIYPPGTVSAYHPLNHGWVCGEIVRRVDGREFPRFLRDEITGPLGMHNTYVGLPAELEGRVAKIQPMADADETNRDVVFRFNRQEVHRAVLPAANGISTAHDMGRFYALLLAGGELDGARIFQPETVARAVAVEIERDLDRTTNMPCRRGLGFNLGGILGKIDPMGRSSTERTFGHGGAGTSICWADRDLDVATVFIPNGFRGDETNRPRAADISDAVRAACR